MACAYDLQDFVEVVELRLDFMIGLELEIHARQAKQELTAGEADVRNHISDFLDNLLWNRDDAILQSSANYI